jgi:site-specific DNA-methyltransferase (adenine-specific)
MLHLITLITPPGGVVLDPFTGSGSTGVAAMYHSPTTRFIGVEMAPEFHAIATARIAYHQIKSVGGVPNPFTSEGPVEVAPTTAMSFDDLLGNF